MTGSTGKKKRKKKSTHPLSHAREVAMQSLYQLELGAQKLDDVLRFGWLNNELEVAKQEFARYLIMQVTQNLGSLDVGIRVYSRVDHSQLSTIIRCLLRMAIYELQDRQAPAAVIMDEYIRLTRKYDGEESVAFVNALLDSWCRENLTEQKETAINDPGPTINSEEDPSPTET